MEIGYLLPTRGVHELRPVVELAREAERLGFASVWAGDSPVSRPRADPLTLLSAVAATTERITIGTAVLLAALRHPILLAQQLATLDRIAEGRLIAGLGAGFPHPSTRREFEAIGIDFDHRITRLTHSVETMRLLWNQDRAPDRDTNAATGLDASTHAGTHGGPAPHASVTAHGSAGSGAGSMGAFGAGSSASGGVGGRVVGGGVSCGSGEFGVEGVELVPRAYREGGPPIWLAGSGGRVLGRVAAWGDGWLPYPPTAEVYAEERAFIGARATPGLYATVCLDEDAERGRGRLRVAIERYYGAPLEAVESLQAIVAGSGREVAAWLGGYAAAGAEHVVIRLIADDQRAGLEELAAALLPGY